MSTQDVDALFRRFAQRGDAQALGQVFDATWDELFRVALHFVERPDEAEDLVQATWLTALEKAREPDPERRLMPWLVGVLALHAREARRKRRREFDPARVEQRQSEPSNVRAESIELADAVRSALGLVPESYRETLRRHLVDGRKAVEIALESGQRPATVRMQLHRGLEHLRKALPAGLALGGAVMLTPTRGAAAVREHLLARAAELALASATSTSGVLLGTTLVMKKLVVAALAAVLLTVLGWWMWGDAAPSGATVAPNEIAQIAAPPPPTVDIAAPKPAADTDKRREVTAASAVAPDPEGEARREALLAACTGRVTRIDGTPIADIAVALLEFDPAVLSRSVGEDPLVPDTTRTDDTGAFTLRRSRPAAHHVLIVDPGGPRATTRLLELAFQSAGTTQIGDVVLDDGVALSGTVTSTDGKPLARARVVALPKSVASSVLVQSRMYGALLELVREGPTSATVLALLDPHSESASLMELDERLARQLEHLPLPTAFADAEGRFEFPSLAAGDVHLIAGAEGFASASIDVLERERANHAAQVRLSPLRDVHVRVVDASGAPLRDAELCLRSGSPSDSDGPSALAFRRMAPTGLDGSSNLRVAASLAEATVLVRSNSSDRWRVMQADVSAPVELRLASTCAWTVEVTDERGEPVAGASVAVVTREDSYSPLRRAHSGLIASASNRARFVARDLAPGAYVARVQAPGFVGVVHAVELTETTTTAVALQRGAPLVVRVVDASTRAPVRDARVSVCFGRIRPSYSSVYSDERGVAELPRWSGEPGGELLVDVEHPAFAPLEVLRIAPDSGDVLVALDRGGALEATLVGLPHGAYTLTLDARGRQQRELRITADGPLVADGLMTGSWSYALRRSFAGRDLACYFAAESQEPLASGSFEISVGARTVIEIGPDAPTAAVVAEVHNFDAPSGQARVQGAVTLDGVPAQGCRVSVLCQRGDMQFQVGSVALDARGRYAIERLPSGEVEIALQTQDGSRAWKETRSLPSSGVLTVDIALRSCALDVRVVDERGSPLAGVDVRCTVIGKAGSTQTTTGDDGRARLQLFGEGALRLWAHHGDLGAAEATADAVFGRTSAPVELVLSKGVPCAGVLKLDALKFDENRQPMLIVGDPKRNVAIEQPLSNTPDGRRFRVHGLQPGAYVLVVWTGAEISDPIEFQLGPAGDEDLEFTFAPERALESKLNR